MGSIPIIEFRYYGKYGHFRKPYTNVSSLSYPFPPRTAIAGLLGAILGVKKEDVANTFDEDKMKVGISLKKEVKTITHVTNFRQDSSGDINYSIKLPKKEYIPKILKNIPDSNKTTQIPIELLREPSYLFYVNLSDKMDELVSRIKMERFVYTPCMGLSEFLGKIEYSSEGIAKQLEVGEFEVSTVICKDECSLVLDNLKPEEEHKIHVLKVPHLGTSERRFTYKNYLVDIASKPIPVQMKVPPYKYKNKIITFL